MLVDVAVSDPIVALYPVSVAIVALVRLATVAMRLVIVALVEVMKLPSSVPTEANTAERPCVVEVPETVEEASERPPVVVSVPVTTRLVVVAFVAMKLPATSDDTKALVEVELVVVPLMTESAVIEDDAFAMTPPLRARSVVVAFCGKRYAKVAYAPAAW